MSENELDSLLYQFQGTPRKRGPVNSRPTENGDETQLDKYLSKLSNEGVSEGLPEEEIEQSDIGSGIPQNRHIKIGMNNIHPEERPISENDYELMKHRTKHAVQSVAKGITRIPDLPQSLYNLGTVPAGWVGADIEQFSPEQMPSHYIEKGIKDKLGIDLNSEQPRGFAEGLVGAGLEGATGAAATAGLGGLTGFASKAAPMATKVAKAVLGSAENLSEAATAATWGAGVSTALKTLQDAGIDTSPLMVGAMALPAARASVNAVKGARNLPGVIKKLGPKNAGHDHAIRALEDIVGVENMPNVVEQLQSATPSESGFSPNTSHLTDNVGLSILEDVYKGAPKHPELLEGIGERASSQLKHAQEGVERLKSVGPEGAQAAQDQFIRAEELEALKAKKGVEKTLKDITPSEELHDIGKAGREELRSELASRKKTRSENVGEEYSLLKNIDSYVEPSNAKKVIADFIDEYHPKSDETTLLKKVSQLLEGDTRPDKLKKYEDHILKDVKKHQKDLLKETLDILGSNKNKAIEKGIIQSQISKLPKSEREGFQSLLEKTRESGSGKGEIPVHVPMLEKSLKKVKDLQREASRSGRSNEARMFGDIANALDKDLIAHPEVSQARAKYATESIPVNKINEHPVFSKILKQSKYKSNDLVADSAVFSKIVNSSKASQTYAKDFLDIFKDNKKAISAAKDAINHDVLSNIMVDGVPSQPKISSYLSKNKGALDINPQLSTYLKNTSNATAFYNKTAAANYKEATQVYKEAAKSIMGGSSDKMMARIMGSNNAVEKIKILKEKLATDKSGKSLEGAKRSVVDLVSEKTNSGANFNRFYKNNIKSLREMFDDEPYKLKFLEEVNKYFRGQSASSSRAVPPGTGSQTAPRLRVQKALEQNRMGLGQTIFDRVMSPWGSLVAGLATKKVLGTAGSTALGLSASGARSWWKDVANVSKEKTIQRVLLDKNYAKMLFQDISTKRGLEAAKKSADAWSKQYISGYELAKRGSDQKKTEEEEE